MPKCWFTIPSTLCLQVFTNLFSPKPFHKSFWTATQGFYSLGVHTLYIPHMTIATRVSSPSFIWVTMRQLSTSSLSGQREFLALYSILFCEQINRIIPLGIELAIFHTILSEHLTSWGMLTPILFLFDIAGIINAFVGLITDVICCRYKLGSYKESPVSTQQSQMMTFLANHYIFGKKFLKNPTFLA